MSKLSNDYWVIHIQSPALLVDSEPQLWLDSTRVSTQKNNYRKQKENMGSFPLPWANTIDAPHTRDFVWKTVTSNCAATQWCVCGAIIAVTQIAWDDVTNFYLDANDGKCECNNKVAKCKARFNFSYSFWKLSKFKTNKQWLSTRRWSRCVACLWDQVG